MTDNTRRQVVGELMKEQTQEMRHYIWNSVKDLKRFGVILNDKGQIKIASLKTKEQVDDFVKTTKEKYLKRHIEKSIDILKDCGVKVTEEHIKYMNSLSSPIYVDNYKQDLIRKIQR